MPIQDVTYGKRWTIEMGGVRGSGRSALVARRDYDDRSTTRLLREKFPRLEKLLLSAKFVVLISWFSFWWQEDFFWGGGDTQVMVLVKSIMRIFILKFYHFILYFCYNSLSNCTRPSVLLQSWLENGFPGFFSDLNAGLFLTSFSRDFYSLQEERIQGGVDK